MRHKVYCPPARESRGASGYTPPRFLSAVRRRSPTRQVYPQASRCLQPEAPARPRSEERGSARGGAGPRWYRRDVSHRWIWMFPCERVPERVEDPAPVITIRNVSLRRPPDPRSLRSRANRAEIGLLDSAPLFSGGGLWRSSENLTRRTLRTRPAPAGRARPPRSWGRGPGSSASSPETRTSSSTGSSTEPSGSIGA